MERIMKRLYEASIEGSLTSLHDLLQEDALILDRCTITSYAETPLHIAAMLGHFDFCSELLRRKPELLGDLDSRRSSALHFASAKGHVDIVKIFIRSRPEMCLVVDGDGNNPIHLAAMKGRVDVLKELVRVHLNAALARVRLCEGGTILHLCVQYYQFEALKFLIEVLKNDELLNAKDDDGNSILHLAVIDKQVETIQYLVANTQIDVSALNSNGLTPIDILNQTRRDSKYLQIIAHSLQISSTQRSQQALSLQQNPPISNVQLGTKNKYDQTLWLERQRNSIMVVASLIATMAFQTGINPRGGFWQDDSHDHEAGNPIWKDQGPIYYRLFLISNTIGFLSSLSIILFLISGIPLQSKFVMWILMVIMWVSISATTISYGFGISVKSLDIWVFYLGIEWLNLTEVLILVHTIRFIRYRTSSWTHKSKVFFWIFMVIVFICVEVSLFHGIGNDIKFGARVILSNMLALGVLIGVLINFLILQYAFQLLLFLVTKMTTCYQELQLNLISTNQNTIVV